MRQSRAYVQPRMVPRQPRMECDNTPHPNGVYADRVPIVSIMQVIPIVTILLIVSILTQVHVVEK